MGQLSFLIVKFIVPSFRITLKLQFNVTGKLKLQSTMSNYQIISLESNPMHVDKITAPTSAYPGKLFSGPEPEQNGNGGFAKIFLLTIAKITIASSYP